MRKLIFGLVLMLLLGILGACDVFIRGKPSTIVVDGQQPAVVFVEDLQPDAVVVDDKTPDDLPPVEVDINIDN